MDAREYLARKGLDGERDKERPNTLEEKAWARAREAGDHRPRAGTPYDWEEWERYHTTLAEGAERIEQKIDHAAHRRALADGDLPRGLSDASAAKAARDAAEAWRPTSGWPAELRPLLLALAVLMPPLVVGLTRGGGRRLRVSLLLTLLGWLPGVVHAWRWVRRIAR